MDDAVYTFKSDVKERRGEANGAHGKRSHCGRGGMSMPSVDYKSKKEIDKLNGPTLSYNIHKPCGWETYRAMPSDVRIEYTKSLIGNFGVSLTQLIEMLGVSYATIRRYEDELGIKPMFPRKGKHITFDRSKWDAFLLGHYVIPSNLPSISKKQLTKSIFSKPEEPEEFVQELIEIEEEPEGAIEKVCDDIANKTVEAVDAVKQMRITRCSISFDGTPDVHSIANTIRLITSGWNSSQIDIAILNT